MGHKSFEELRANAEKNGYVNGEQSQQEKAQAEGIATCTLKTMRDQDCYLKLYSQ